MTLDRLHQGTRMRIGARRPLTIIIGDARPEIVRPNRDEIRDADPVEIGQFGHFRDADEVEHGAGAADRGAWPDRTLDTAATVLRHVVAEPVLIVLLPIAHAARQTSPDSESRAKSAPDGSQQPLISAITRLHPDKS